MNKQIILLNGPSSSGKSTLSKALSDLIYTKTHDRYEIVSIDDFMKTSPMETIYEDDVYEISGDMCVKISELTGSGTGVIIDHVITSERIYNQLIDSQAPNKVRTVHVDCPLEVLKKREQDRGDRVRGAAEASYEYLYPKSGYEITIDSSAGSSEANAELIYNGLFE